MWISFLLPVSYLEEFGWATVEDKKVVPQQMQQVIIHHVHQAAPAPQVIHHVQQAEAPKKVYSEDEDDSITDANYFAKKVERIALELKGNDLEKLNGLKVFITKLWERNLKLPVIIRCSSRQAFWKKHESTARNRLRGNLA